MKKSRLLYISMSRAEKLLGWLYMAFSLFALPSILVWVNGKLADPVPESTLNFVFYLTNFLFISGIFHRFLRASLIAAWQDLWNFIQAVVLGYVAYWAATKAMDFVMGYLMPGFSNINDTAIAELARTNYTLMLTGVVFLVPLSEEMLYRGLIFRNLWQDSKIAAFLLSMAAFAAVHVLGYIGTADITTLIVCFIQYLPAGLCLAWTYTKADNIFAPVVVHAIVNAVAIGALR
ncbi:MAG: CPBP family intramembrane metalloprotease [Oscillospiraceae bacterium]|nr:CPBP family intramembrane metalloprotease [Oscillospiraceae bacterium]